jgi:lactate permease
VHNVVAASATVGLVDREGEIIRRTLIPTFYYIVQGGLIASALIAGGFNFWWVAAIVWAAGVLTVMAFNRGRPVPVAAASAR